MKVTVFEETQSDLMHEGRQLIDCMNVTGYMNQDRCVGVHEYLL